jgi:response regulator of citrate/malate metabolism
MVSSLATATHVQQAIQAGACAFVVKPFNSAKVNNVIQQCLQKITSVGKTAGNR